MRQIALRAGGGHLRPDHVDGIQHRRISRVDRTGLLHVVPGLIGRISQIRHLEPRGNIARLELQHAREVLARFLAATAHRGLDAHVVIRIRANTIGHRGGRCPHAERILCPLSVGGIRRAARSTRPASQTR